MKHEKQCWVATKCFPYQHKNNCIYDQIIHFEIFIEKLMSVKSDKKKSTFIKNPPLEIISSEF